MLSTSMTKLERRRRIASASRELRLRKKVEFENLKRENKRLKRERSEFISTMNSLSAEIHQKLHKHCITEEDVEENQKLKQELEAQKKMMNVFVNVMGGYPTEASAKAKLFTEGSDSAQSYLLSLLCQSQTDWKPTTFATPIDHSFQIHYKYTNSLFGVPEERSTKAHHSRLGKRLNLRLDCHFPAPSSPQVIAECLKNMLSDVEISSRVGCLSKEDKIELRVEHNSPDDHLVDARIVHYKHKKLNREACLIVTKKRSSMAKTSLALPNQAVERTRVEGDHVSSSFGDIETWCVAMTSTTLRSVAPIDVCEENRITSLIVQGAIIWEDEEAGEKLTKLCFITSVPQEYVLLERFSIFDNLISREGVVTSAFSQWIIQMIGSFKQIMQEEQDVVVEYEPTV